MPHILLIEDNVPLREEVSEFFVRRNYTVRDVGRLAEARAALAECEPDAVISDINLPDGDGAAFWGEHALSHPGTRWLLVSGDPGAADRVRRSIGGGGGRTCAVLTKPVSMRVLEEFVRGTGDTHLTLMDVLAIETNVDAYLSRLHQTWDAERRDRLLRQLTDEEARMGRSRMHLENGERRVMDGRDRLTTQRERVAQLAAARCSIDQETSLLTTFEKTQALLEAHLEALRTRFEQAKL